MIVVGVDFGTQSVRATILDANAGKLLSSAAQGYAVQRSADDPLLVTQSHYDQMAALQAAVSAALRASETPGDAVVGMACSATSSSVIVTDEHLQPITDHYLWCDHRAHKEAQEITQAAHARGFEGIQWCGGTYSHEWGFAKLLHFLRHNPDLRSSAALALENCDMITATLCGVSGPDDLVRSTCAMGHKWMWGTPWGGFPDDAFLGEVDPLLAKASQMLRGKVVPQGGVAGYLSDKWAQKLGLRAGISVGVGAIDAHWDAVGAGASRGDMVNIIGTSTCLIGVLPGEARAVRGVSGVVPGSVLPDGIGIEAGMSAVGDLFQSVARRNNSDLVAMTDSLNAEPRRITGLVRIPWDNGDRTILVDANLGGVLVGLDLEHTALDELQAAIEGTALQTRLILDHIGTQMVPFERIINGGGIPPKNPFLNQVYADILNRPVCVPKTPTTGIGAGIFAAVAAGLFPSVEDAQAAFCPEFDVIEPDPAFVARYDETYEVFHTLYHALGNREAGQQAKALKILRRQRVGQ